MIYVNKTKMVKDNFKYKNTLTKRNQIKRLIWDMVWFLFAKPFPRSVGNGWRLFLLRCFGAKIHKTSVVYSSVKIYQPWCLIMEEYACLAPEVDCYNVGTIVIEAYATVSQKTYLCAASHNIYSSKHELIFEPIVIKKRAWVGADAFIAMGVTIGEGAVVGARAAVFKNVEDWSIVGGNPAKFLKKRSINE
jgi:putative colanic acid biosynthesis acetyltransferase WcaF